MSRTTSALAKLSEAIDEIRIVNTHTHVCTRPSPEGELPGRPPGAHVDLFDLMRNTYVGEDMMSAGLPFEIKTDRQKYDPDSDPEIGWKTMAPYLDRVRGCISYRSLVWMFQDLYGFGDDEITDSNWRALNDQITARALEEDWDLKIHDDVCRYAVSIKGKGGPPLHPDYFAEVIQLAPFLYVCSHSEAEIAEKLKAVECSFDERMRIAKAPRDVAAAEDQRENYNNKFGRPESLGDVLDALDGVFAEYKARGAVAMKIGIAYSRRLRFEDVSRADAERVFNTPPEKRSLLDVTAYQDFIVHEGIKRCAEHNIRVQFHTGHLAGPGAYIDNSNPIYLANLFLQYPEARFDLFHGSYPFCGQLGTLAKNFANVHLNTCWMPSVTLSGSKYWLREWIETVPNNKILWGDDSQNIETCAAAVILGKKVVGETLAEMVDDDYFSIGTAIGIAERILRRNALEFYDFKREY